MAMVKKIEYRNLPNMFLKAREVLLGQFRPIITHFGLTEQQWRILRVLADAGELEQREISETCAILGPSLTGVLSRMEDMDLIVRTRMEEDQRRVTVRMTKLGEKIVDTLSPLITQQYRNLEQAFGPALIAEVFSVLDRFVDADREAIRQVELPDRRAVDKEIARLMK
jgi:homoprotocatechuate degradation regulator HpaR